MGYIAVTDIKHGSADPNAQPTEQVFAAGEEVPDLGEDTMQALLESGAIVAEEDLAEEAPSEEEADQELGLGDEEV